MEGEDVSNMAAAAICHCQTPLRARPHLWARPLHGEGAHLSLPKMARAGSFEVLEEPGAARTQEIRLVVRCTKL